MSTSRTSRAPRPALGRAFLTVWFGQTVSTIGSTLSAIGAAVWVYVSTGSVVWLGVFAALSAVPVLIATPLTVLVDRCERRAVMIWADVAAAAGPAVALAVATTGRLEPWHVAVAGFVGGLGTAVQTPAYQAALPELVRPEALGRANGLVQFAPALGIVLGPALATPIVAWWGIEAVLLVDLATFAVGVAATVATRFESAPADPTNDRAWSAGVRWLRGPGRPLAALLGVVAVVNLVLSYFNVAVVAAATDLGGTARAGLVLAAGGVAMVAGSIACGVLGVPTARIRALATALVVMAVGCALAAGPHLVWLLVGVPVALAVVPTVNAVTATLFHERVPRELQGRVFGIRSAIGRTLDPIGSISAGFVMARLAAPAIADDGPLAGSLGRLVGTGPDRASAVVLVAVAVALVGTAAVLRTSRAVRPLDAPVVDLDEATVHVVEPAPVG